MALVSKATCSVSLELLEERDPSRRFLFCRQHRIDRSRAPRALAPSPSLSQVRRTRLSLRQTSGQPAAARSASLEPNLDILQLDFQNVPVKERQSTQGLRLSRGRHITAYGEVRQERIDLGWPDPARMLLPMK